jgi:ABC-2 type transport system ATP-binding protein
MTPAIRIDELTKDYWLGFWRKRPYRALDRLSLEVQPGEVFGFLGPNGAGKTTTLKLLMQLIFPTAGHAEILGRPVGDVRARQRIGYLPDMLSLPQGKPTFACGDGDLHGVGLSGRCTTQE